MWRGVALRSSARDEYCQCNNSLVIRHTRHGRGVLHYSASCLFVSLLFSPLPHSMIHCSVRGTAPNQCRCG